MRGIEGGEVVSSGMEEAGPATMTSRAVWMSRWRGDDGKEVRRDLPQ